MYAGIGAVAVVLMGVTVWLVLKLPSLVGSVESGVNAAKPSSKPEPPKGEAPVPPERRQRPLEDGDKSFPNSIGLRLVWIPPGEFMMGTPDSERDRKYNEYLHRVKITRGFHLGIYAVTQAEYQRVMGTNPSAFPGDKRPVEMVSWDDAAKFCRKLSDLAEEKAAGRVYRLPTDAEWERACRADTTRVYYCGYTLNADQANFNALYKRTLEVGCYPPNLFGLYDMHGNSWQWCQDWYVDDLRSLPQDDPHGPDAGDQRVLRGGSWYNWAPDCRDGRRYCQPPHTRLNDVGFRVACDIAK